MNELERARLADELCMWIGWIESCVPMGDTNRLLMAEDMKRAVSALKAPNTHRTSETPEHVQKGAIVSKGTSQDPKDSA